LKGKKYDKSYQNLCDPSTEFGFGIVNWTPTDLENLQTKMKTLLTTYSFHHPCPAKERLTLPWQMDGKGLVDVI